MKKKIPILILLFVIFSTLCINAEYVDLPTDPEDCIAQSVKPIYPKTALKDGSEGIVDLLITIAASGDVCYVEIVKSSGNAYLDANAVTEIQMLWTFKSYPYSYTITLKVEYKDGDAKVILGDLNFLEREEIVINHDDLKAYKSINFKDSVEQVKQKLDADTEMTYSDEKTFENFSTITAQTKIFEHDFTLTLDFYHDQLYRVVLNSMEFSDEIGELLVEIISQKYGMPDDFDLEIFQVKWYYRWDEQKTKADKFIHLGSSSSFNVVNILYNPIMKLIMKEEHIENKKMEQEHNDKVKTESENF